MTASNVTIYHNPQCSTSRSVLALLREAGVEPVIVEYLKTPPDRTTLTALLAAMQLPVRDLMRRKEALYTELNLDNPTLSDEQLLDAMLKHPVLMNRPVVKTDKGVRLCRPAERVHEIL